MMTSEYNEWWNKRVNDNIPRLKEEDVQPIGEYLQLGLDVDIQKLETDKWRKGKNKAEEDLDSLKEKTKVDQWEKRFQNARAREHRSRNFAVELKACLSKIEELRGKIGELDDTLHNGEFRIELLDRGNEQWQKQFHHSQDQIRERDYIMGEAVAQVCEVADHLQTLAVQADVLSLKYESESDRGQDLAWLLKKVKALSIKVKPYM
ncbi:hypothetical protein Goshw_025682 [Gossypium schwendimanii]|uniref:Tektin n=1 Tax=Gossypium schwendimanii TaxID=34291 RepID=A0A7J9N7R6_GOSSC|nr:hypothetical protein [Gossypium schwendimanii]